MAKIRSLYKELKTYSFELKINSVIYFHKESPNPKNDGTVVYLAKCICKEIKNGRDWKDNKLEFPAEIWLTKEQYENKVIHKNDTIKVGENANWVYRGSFSRRIYDLEVLKRVSPTNIRIDFNHNPYYVETFYRFALSVPNGEWKLFDNASQDYIANVSDGQNNLITLEFDSREDLVGFKGGDFSIENWEYNKLQAYDNQEIIFKPIAQRIPLDERRFMLSLEFYNKGGFWILHLNKI